MSDFSSLGLAEPLARAVAACGYTTPTPVQAQAIPPLLEGRDLLGCAQTGTGKTAAFALPVLQRLALQPFQGPGRRPIRALILTPTRELAAQIGASLETYGAGLGLRHAVVFGGVGQRPQEQALRAGLDILVACPGRLLDLHGQGHVDLSRVQMFVLDEADRMLDMGFIHDVRRVLRVLPGQRQNLLFSATMPAAIVELAGSFLRQPVRIDVSPERITVERIRQTVMFAARSDKPHLLKEILRQDPRGQTLVFTRTKHGANRLVKQLENAGIAARALHGNKSQAARTQALDAFRARSLGVLVATDVASRGIDVDGISRVVNFDLPNEPESYVHRIGRTGRAGRDGDAIALCDPSESDLLRAIERLIGHRIQVDANHDWHTSVALPAAPPSRAFPGRGAGSTGQGHHSRRRGGQARSGLSPFTQR